MQKDERVQVKLMQGDSILTCWVDKDVKTGQWVTLKPPAPLGKWLVYTVSHPVKASSINSNRDYRVGGL